MAFRHFKVVLSVTVIVLSLLLCQRVISHSLTNQINKKEYAELHDIKYGLLSMNKWKKQLSFILEEEIKKFSFTKGQEKELKKHIEAQLNLLIDKVHAEIKKSNTGSLTGWVKQTFINLFLSIEDIKKGIPEYADAIIKGMSQKKSEGKIKNLLADKLQEYLDETFDKEDTSQLQSILRKRSAYTIEDAEKKIKEEIALNEKIITRDTVAIILLSVLLFLAAGLSKEPLNPFQYTALVLLLLMLLLVGITTPMIDIEAKISKISFVLMDHPIHFYNQVLYFQSKSILDVFWIMVNDQALEMKFVGFLMITFSTIFPLFKLSASLAYYFGHQKPWTRFFIFKSGKWSMADVMVVAIFMAYIGFNGIIGSQLKKLNAIGEDVVAITTNGTSLQPGYYIFLSYALLALILSEYLAKKSLMGSRIA